MAYSGAIGGNIITITEPTVGDLTSTSATAGVICTLHTGGLGFEVQMFGVRITTAPTVTAPVVSCFARPTNGSATAERLIGRITVPLTAVAGDTFRGFIGVRTSSSESGDVDAIVNPGEAVVLRCTTAATAGAGVGFIHGTPFAVGDAITSSAITKAFGGGTPVGSIYNLTVAYT